MDFDDLDDAEEDAIGENGPERRLPPWKHVQGQQFEYGEMKERAALKLPGDYHGIEFPFTKDDILKGGPAWLTKAFHTSGVLPVDNEVTKVSMKDVTGSVSGGAGLKYTLTVEYKEPKDYLHTDLFCKLPHEPKGSDRYYVSVMWGHDRPESIFNIWLASYVPFKVPKMYFCDICAQSTNFILITERVKFAEKEKKDFGPGDIERAFDKYSDWDMSDGGPMYYLAALKNLGKMAAYHRTGKLHPQVNEMFPMPGEIREVPKGLPGMDPTAKKMEMAKVDQFVKFMSETAVNAFPKELCDKKFLNQLKLEFENVFDWSSEMHCYSSGAGTSSPNDYVVLTHNNLQVDNAIYWHKEDNSLDVGMLDWGVLGCSPFVSAIHGGCISGCQPHIYMEYRDRFVKAALDSYEEHGGPKLDFDRVIIMCDLALVNWCSGCPKNTAAILKDCKQGEWETISKLTDDRVRKKWNAWAWSMQFRNTLELWQKMGVYKKFQAWLKDQGLPAKK